MIFSGLPLLKITPSSFAVLFTQQGELKLYLENRNGKNTFIP
ncbi:Uncharacterised protein [Escherichia coli]|nr:Uncharacterised protein [Escherichia coli]